MRQLTSISVPCLKVDIKISLFGIRNLAYPARKPVFTLRLTHGLGEEKVVKLER
jgi:hypothetical protein